MRLKEIQRTAHQAWSPAGQHPVCLALGTSAQQLDASFNTTAALEIFELDFSDPSLDMQLKGSLHTSNRLHSIVWVNFGMGADGTGGRLIGGSENGALTVYNPEPIMSSGADAVVGQSDKHTGPVRALDFNPYQSNLLASGANDSEIYIWDLNNFSSPMTPGAKTQVLWFPPKDMRVGLIAEFSVRSTSRNYCLGTQFTVQFTNPAEDISVVSWNRQVQHILASASPSGKAVVWDLRKNEPIIKISDHSNRMHCSGMLWHPDVATQLVLASEDDRLPVIQMWDLRFATSPLKVLENHTRGILSISWSQADSDLLLSSAKDNRILCWNPNTGEFGGKLITFENPKLPPMQSPQPSPRQVFVSQVTTETEFLQRSRELQAALQSGSFNNYCQAKIQNAKSDAEQDIWKFLLVNFEDEARIKFLRLLGFSKDDLEKKISKCLGKNFQPNGHGVDAKDLADKMQRLSTERSDEATAVADARTSGSVSPADFFSQTPKESSSFQIPVSCDTDGLISQALLVGNFEGAVDLCLNDGRYAEAILLSISGGEELLKKTQQKYLSKQKNSISMLISSVVTQNWRDIVQSCELDNWKEALAALLTYAHPEDFARLCDILGGRLEREETEKRCLQACLCYICSGNIEKLVECWALHRDCSSPLGLEDLVEKVMMLRKSIERLRNSEVAVQSPILAEKLTCYAGILAAEGSLSTAISYLPENSDQPGIMMLRERLFHAQGETAIGQQPPNSFNRVNVSTSKPTPAAQTNAPKSQIMSQYQPSAPSQVPAQPQLPVPSLFNPQATPANTGPGLPLSSHALPPSATRPAMRPSYPQHPAPAPGFLPQQPFQPQPVPMGRPSAFSPPGPSMPAANLSGPPLPSSSSTPSGLHPMPSPGVPPTGFIPSTSLASGLMPPSSQPGAPVPMYPGTLHNQGPTPPMGSGPYSPLGSGYPQGGPGAPAVKPFPAPVVAPPPTGPQEGWNDPPTVRSGPRKKKVPDNYTPPAPITAPVMRFPVEAPQPHDHAQVPPGAPQEPSVQLLQQLPAERVEQKDIPAEHMALKSTFDSLVQRCQLAAGDPQTKRKLDDASKRLGYLYDKLREQSLSQNILNGLHEISRCVASQNYQRGLEVHTQVVSSSNFSEISAFMPILKVLMTIANKLGV
ncbi:Protein transport protein Sec31B SEC31-like protein 2 SEC31-related protein B SEC31B-1 [Channa argus]|uniref:Protein transport protein Sec31B SEC31-like protein 2 SEC31-related protein B SEC31B-1 n=1 Tax=Channa argus TaxID=215402 RepID=A0A6G1QQF6_CHAAH|nr:Protein transport protein Sec31B SEC31-like protein 2 SEC31-related protein B SEC31B-1 [Channa argus]